MCKKPKIRINTINIHINVSAEARAARQVSCVKLYLPISDCNKKTGKGYSQTPISQYFASRTQQPAGFLFDISINYVMQTVMTR